MLPKDRLTHSGTRPPDHSEPAYVWESVTVIGTDVYGLDDDGDGTGCDSLGG